MMRMAAECALPAGELYYHVVYLVNVYQKITPNKWLDGTEPR